ncbi:MAG: hypothetical protein ACJ776_07920 [Chloroflexota bacterium]
MTGAFAGRDSSEIDALVTDRYLETLLAAHGRGADRAPTASIPQDTIRATADRLARDLPRLHPSFRFEEALAARLAEVAWRMRSVPTGDPSSVVVPGPDPAEPDAAAGLTDLRSVVGRPLIIGGALTSAALSIAGAAYVAWRLNRPPSPMARAARAVSRTRLV